MTPSFIAGVLEVETGKEGRIFEEIMLEHLLNLMKDINLDLKKKLKKFQIEAMGSQRDPHLDITVQLSKNRNKKRLFKTAGED